MEELGRPKCLICGFNRCVDRAHLIPRRLVTNIIGVRKLASFKGKNVISLCKNHHFLFDNNRLTNEEWKIIIEKFKPLNKELDILLNSNLIAGNKQARIEHNKKLNIFNKWKNVFSEKLCEYGLFERIK